MIYTNSSITTNFPYHPHVTLGISNKISI